MTRRAKSGQPQRLARPGTPRSMETLWADITGDPSVDAPVAMRVLSRLDGVVNTLGQSGGKPLTVRFGNVGGGTPAATDLSGRRVAITADPLRLGERVLGTRLSRLAVVAGLAIHEAGHVLLSEPHGYAVRERAEFYAKRRHRGGPDANRRHVRWVKHAHHLSNLLDDVLLELHWQSELPAYGPLFALVSWWLYAKDLDAVPGQPTGVRVYDRMPTSADEGWALAVAAVRYANQCQFVGDEVRAEARWWELWARRYTKALQTDNATHLRGIAAGLDRLDTYTGAESEDGTPGPDGQPQPGQDGQPQPGGDQPDGEGDDTEGEGEPQPGEGDDDTEGDEPEDGDDLDGEGDGDSTEGEDGDGEMCACGCRARAVLTAYLPVYPGCTDPACECHGGTELQDGGSGLGTDQPDEAEGPEDGEADGEGKGEGNESDGEADGDKAGADTDGTTAGGGTGDRTNTEPQNVDGYDNPLDSHVEPNEADRELGERVDTVIEAVRKGRREVDVHLENRVGETGKYTERVTIDPVERDEQYRVDVPRELASALVTAYQTTRRSASPQPSTSGRLSNRRLSRLWTDETPRVFTSHDETGGKDPLALYLLLDCSSSMGSGEMGAAKRVIAGLVQAMGNREKNLRIRVLGFGGTTAPGVQPEWQREGYDPSGNVRVNDVWLQDAWDSRSRRSVTGGLAALNGNGGTPTAGALMATALIARDERLPRERALIVVLTDGQPNHDSAHNLPTVVDTARQWGTEVVALGIGTIPDQDRYFGPGAWIPWSGDWHTLGASVAGLIGKFLSR